MYLFADVTEGLLGVLEPQHVESMAYEREPDRRSCWVGVRQSGDVVPHEEASYDEEEHFEEHLRILEGTYIQDK